jgi:hypothetical protein
MPQNDLQSNMATGPGTQGINLQGSEDVSQGSSAYFNTLTPGAGAYGDSSAANYAALAHQVMAMNAFFIARGDYKAL